MISLCITSLLCFIALTCNVKLSHTRLFCVSLCHCFICHLLISSPLSLCCCFFSLHLFVCSFLAKRGVREDIATFEARNITPEIRQSVEELLNRNKASFDPKVS